MRGKIQPGPAARRILALVGLAAASLASSAQRAEVTGRVTMLEKEHQPGDDVGQAVVWLSGPAAQPRPPIKSEIGTSKKEFSPHILVVPVGSTVSFPNYDPFNHNVFSLSEESPFDLGLYGRGEVRSMRFDRPGLVLVDCNVHAQMSAWHERAPEVIRPLEVPGGGAEQLAVELDARGFQFKPHLNKHGQPYPQQGRRY